MDDLRTVKQLLLSTARPVRPPLQEFGVLWRSAANCLNVHIFAIVRPENAHLCFAQARRSFEHRIENWREIAQRGNDDLEDLGSRGLLFESLTRLGQKPCVLHRDDRLGGEVLQKRKLLTRERADLLARYPNDPEQPLLLSQRNAKPTAQPRGIHPCPRRRVKLVFGTLKHICEMNDLLAIYKATEKAARFPWP
jgi:hypothetical protein